MQNKFSEILKSKNDCVIITSPQNRRYFTSFNSSDGFLVITGNETIFFTDSRYIEAAQNQVTVCKSVLLKRVSETIAPYLKEKNIENIYLETERLTVAELNSLKKVFDFCKVEAKEEVDEIINKLRSVKTEKEVEYIKKAQQIAEDAFKHILKFIKVGVTEKEIALKLDFYMLSHGAEAVSFETIAVSGKNSSMPHGVPTDKRIENGDFITMDFGAVYNGYHSDMTRTVIVGEPTEKQKEVYETVLKAQTEALAVLKAGVSGVDADKAARDIIEAKGYKENFGHGTGHGVGIEIHESPNLSPYSKAILETGNIVTVEPGIYIPDEFGVRIEDMALITENGYINLTNCEKELIIL
ncbi:MAG: aminopeptidase P family protein [Ruminococcaceae bacterium]|nr:aminopeptidase P family protein [Oscillospiraceae bacterium]